MKNLLFMLLLIVLFIGCTDNTSKEKPAHLQNMTTKYWIVTDPVTGYQDSIKVKLNFDFYTDDELTKMKKQAYEIWLVEFRSSRLKK